MLKRAVFIFLISLLSHPALSEEPKSAVYWGIQAQQLERRYADNGSDLLAWKIDSYTGKDELKIRLENEGEYADKTRSLGRMETRLLLETPISDFFDGTAGLRYDSPVGPNRYYGSLGIKGLAPQWIEVSLDMFVSEKGAPSLRMDADYEALITNDIVLTPTMTIDLPLQDDKETGVGGMGPKLELGARLRYDLIDRAVSPYVGVHFEKKYGETATLAREDGESSSTLYFLTGIKLLF